jgi:S-methylmethionine-dependent homocysteine/selenocysteine methylase
MAPDPLRARLTRGDIILLDGALGTELERLGVSTSLPLWSAQALLDAPDRVRDVHESYIQAGADVITSATFRTTPRALKKAGLAAEADRLTKLAIELAKEARDRAAPGREVRIAGSMAPLEDCYKPELSPAAPDAEREHRDQAERLARAGAELLLIETVGTAAEAAAAVRAARTTDLPVWISFLCKSGTELMSGEPLASAVRLVTTLTPDAVLVNCVPVAIATECLEVMGRASALPYGCYANAGSPDMGRSTWCFDPEMTPERFAEAAAGWLQRGAQIVGGCCGTGPDHIRALRDALPPVLME